MKGRVRLNESALELFTRSFESKSKILVLGGTGWFGRTALAMLMNMDVEVHVVASNPREFSVDGASLEAKSWDPSEIVRFEPEIVLDFAYLTVDKSGFLGLEQYTRVNQELSNRLSFASHLPSVSRVLTVSSGASVRLPLAMRAQPAAEAYARGKRAIEANLEQIASDRAISVGVARAWSVTGGHVQNPRRYGFSGMISDGLASGWISVQADHLVYRRYSAVEELLALAMPSSEKAAYSEVDSGGNLVEIRDLARFISAAIPGSQVVANDVFPEPENADLYFADDEEWNNRMATSGVEPLTLEVQIENVVRSLRGD